MTSEQREAAYTEALQSAALARIRAARALNKSTEVGKKLAGKEEGPERVNWLQEFERAEARATELVHDVALEETAAHDAKFLLEATLRAEASEAVQPEIEASVALEDYEVAPAKRNSEAADLLIKAKGLIAGAGL